jgi:hypothetical protein
LAVIAFLAPAFFGSAATLASWSLVAGNLLVLAAAGIAINRLAFHGEHTAFIMELPLYHLPNARTVGLYVWHNTVEFVKKAGTLILIASVVVWALSTLPGRGVESSYLASFGRWLEPAGQPIGLGDWRVLVALLTSFFAKENTIATLGILYGTGGGVTELPAQVAAMLAPAARMAFMVVSLLFIPCLATATIKQETVLALDRSERPDSARGFARRRAGGLSGRQFGNRLNHHEAKAHPGNLRISSGNCLRRWDLLYCRAGLPLGTAEALVSAMAENLTHRSSRPSRSAATLPARLLGGGGAAEPRPPSPHWP